MPLYEFQPSFTVDQTDLTLTSTGSGVHLNKAVTVDLDILDRTSGSVLNNTEFLANSYVSSVSVDILNLDGSVEYQDFLTDYKSNVFTFTEYDNINVFGQYTKDFGIKITLSETGQSYTSEFYFYGNVPEISGIEVQDSTGTTSHSSSQSSKTAVNSSGQTGALTSVVTFNNDIGYTSFDRIEVYSSSSSDAFASQINPNPVFSRSITNQSVQVFDINEGVLPNDSPVYLHYVPYGNLGSGASWSVGPYTFEDNPIATNQYITKDDTGDFLTAESQTLEQVTQNGRTTNQGIDITSNNLNIRSGNLYFNADNDGYTPYGVFKTGSSDGLGFDYDGSNMYVTTKLGGTQVKLQSTQIGFETNSSIGLLVSDTQVIVDNSRNLDVYDGSFFVSGNATIGGRLRVTGVQDSSQRMTFEDPTEDSSAEAFLENQWINSNAYTKQQSYSLAIGPDQEVGSSNENRTYSEGTAVIMGIRNTISGDFDFIGAGVDNLISGSDFAGVIGGSGNDIWYSDYSITLGGQNNTITGSDNSFVGAGVGNIISGADNSHIFGSYATIQHSGVTYLTDSNNRTKESDASDTLFIDFEGGVDIKTGDLTVEESITMGGNTVLTGITSAEVIDALGYTPLSTETDDQTLDEVLTQGNTSQSGITVGSSTISGDLDVSGALTVTNDDTGVSDIFSVDGVNGRLFGVTDEVTGTIFSVNDAAGLPILEVESTSTYDKITIGEYGTDALVISGTNSAIFNVDVDITGGLDVTGDITMGGETVLTGITSSDVTDALGYTPVDVNDTGDFVTSSETGSFLTAHPSIAAASSSDNSARTYIQDVLLDSFGHVTGLNTSSESTDPNYYLTGVSKAGNVFTFEVDGATNPTYTLTSGDITGALGFSPISTETDSQDLDSVLGYGNSSELGIIVGDISGTSLDITTDVTVTGDVEADEFIGDLRGAVSFRAKAGEALSAGEVVYISGIDGNTTVVAKADANDSNKMPAFGVSKETVSANANVRVVNFGSITNLDTSNYSEGDELFVSDIAGQLTGIAPTGEASALQKMAKVTRSDNSAGSITVMGAGRSNAVPNLNEGRLFVGNSSNEAVADGTIHVDIANSNVGIGTTDPSSQLTISKNSSSTYTSSDAGTATGDLVLQNNNQTVNNFNRISFQTPSANSGGNILDAARITAIYSDHGGANPSAHLSFETKEDAGTMYERMRIDSDGNVGIGTTSPSRKFEVHEGNVYLKVGAQSGFADGYGPILTTNSNSIVAPERVYLAASQAYIRRENIGGQGLTLHGDTFSRFTYYNGSSTVEALRIDNAGNVGIGTTSPSAPLDISSSATGGTTIELDNTSTGGRNWTLYSSGSGNSFGAGKFALYDADAASVRMLVDTSGNVGIGTTSPQASLHVAGDIGNTPTGNGVLMGISTSGASNYGHIQLNGDTGSYIDFSSSGVDRKGRILYNNAANYMQIQTNGSDKVRITSSGNVGIGTTSPSATLDVNGAGNFSGGTVVSGVDTKTNVGVSIAKGDYLVSNDGSYLRNIIGHATNGNIEIGQATVLIGDIILKPGSSGAIAFYGSGSEDARFDSNGRLGIGTTSAEYELHVIGTASFTDTVAGAYFEENASHESLKSMRTGTILVMNEDGDLVPCSKEDDTMVFGVVKKGYKQPIIMGAEPIKVTGPIKVGDYITTSDVLGHGKKSNQPYPFGTIIAQAMESGDGESYNIKAMIRKM